MRARIAVVAIVAAALLPFTSARAEKPDMSSKQMRECSTHVVVGKVIDIYTQTRTDPGWRTTRYCTEVRIDKVEKGKGLTAGGLVYVRYWDREWVGRGDMPPSTTGHRGLPKAGETLRIYLARNANDQFGDDGKDGGYNVLGANGFERLTK